MNNEYPPAMQSAQGCKNNYGTSRTLKYYRESTQRHFGQIEQGISNDEVSSQHIGNSLKSKMEQLRLTAELMFGRHFTMAVREYLKIYWIKFAILSFRPNLTAKARG